MIPNGILVSPDIDVYFEKELLWYSLKPESFPLFNIDLMCCSSCNSNSVRFPLDLTENNSITYQLQLSYTLASAVHIYE